MELWDNVYLNYTTLQFQVIAMDNGTIPRGHYAEVNITVSNTCVMDVLFGDITYIFAVDKSTGGMTLRIPKYYVVDFCKFRNKQLKKSVMVEFNCARGALSHYICTQVCLLNCTTIIVQFYCTYFVTLLLIGQLHKTFNH